MRQLKHELSAAEFKTWRAFNMVDPITSDRADHRAGVVASVVANVHRGRHQPAYVAADFMPDYDKRYARHSGQVMMQQMHLLLAQQGAVDGSS